MNKDDMKENTTPENTKTTEDASVSTEPLSEVDALKKELEKVTLERDEYLNGWQRAKADFANAKKRMDESAVEYRKFANEGLIEEFLPTLQSFELAFANKEAWEKADKNWRMGVEYIYTQIKSVLEQNGLQEVSPMGEKFDHTKHEAVRYEKTQDGAGDGTIIQVLEKGYMLSGKLIKPAKVVVASASEESVA